MNKMTEKILGLDLGASSIGWALLEVPVLGEDDNHPEIWSDGYFEGGKILRTGVRIFTAGKENFDSSKEKSLAESRRKSRGMRRRTRRVRERKIKLKNLLKEHGLWPEEDLEKSTKDPLELRARGISEKLTLGELGQALYHLAQRRGFRSARKTAVKAKPKKNLEQEETSDSAQGTEKEEKKEDILANISLLAEEIEKSGKQTLGAYLYSLRQDDKHKRVRKRHTRRNMYFDEFTLLWNKQAEYHPKVLTEELKKKIGEKEENDKYKGIIFYQRNIYWRQSTIGNCELEEGEQRCPRADRLAQEFRFYQEINNLKYLDPETDEEVRVADRPEWLEKIVELGRKKEKIKFDDIRKVIGLEGTSIRFNLETGTRRKNKKTDTEEETFRAELKGFETDAILRKKKYFGDVWDKIEEELKNKIVRVILEKPSNPDSEKMEFDDKGRARQMTEEELRAYFVRDWKWWLFEDDKGKKTEYELTDKQIDALVDDIENELPKGYLSLSRKALRNLRPWMRQGLLFSGTAAKGGNYNDALHNAGYHRKDEDKEWEIFAELPVIEKIKGLGMINNPVVRRIVNESRRLINAIIKKYGRPDKIHVELARNAKANSEQRKKITRQNNQNKEAREKAKKRIEEFREYKIKPTGDAILRLRLWEQQNEICPYSGKIIGIAQLFDRSGVIDVDHILPYSRTLDDSQMNKVVCFRDANADKEKNRTPYEWFKSKYHKNFDKEWERFKERLAKYPIPKRTRLLQKELSTEDFTERQLNDTKYASRYMLQYLRSLFTPEEWKTKRRILTVKGGQTSDLRYHWGLNDILHNSDFLPDDLEPGEKNRNDHRHHAVDAIVIALTDTRQLRRLALYKYRSQKQAFPKPWLTFRRDAETSINKIIVSHRPIGRVRGGLHDDTNYGPMYQSNGRQNKNRIEGEYVVRKTLTALSAAEFFKIRDERIKKLVFERLAEHGIEPVKKGKKEGSEKLDIKPAQIKEAFAEPLYLLPKNGKVKEGVHLSEIKKVRLVVKNETPIPLKKETAFVIPGSNHHICLFEKQEDDRLKRYAVFVTRLEANQRLSEQQRRIRAKRKELQTRGLAGHELEKQLRDYRRIVVTQEVPIVRRSDPDNPTAKFLFTLKRGEMFKVLDKGVEKFVIFKTAPSTTKNFCFVDQRDACKDVILINKSGSSYFDILEKVAVNRLGDISLAND
jgi:CRISPR-associated endonuclease Csn1